MEQQSFMLLTAAEVMWAICGSSAGVQRDSMGQLDCWRKSGNREDASHVSLHVGHSFFFSFSPTTYFVINLLF